VYGCDPQTKIQSAQWKYSVSLRPKKAGQVQNNVKMMHHEYTPLGQTVIKEYYQEVLYHLHDAVRGKRPELWDACNWQLRYTWSRVSWPSTPFNRFNRLPALLTWLLVISGCSRDWRQQALKVSRFESQEDIIQNAQLHTIPKQAFQKCF
jgi:hypothetical protein